MAKISTIILHIHFFIRNDWTHGWLFIHCETKPRSCVQVVKDVNDKVIGWEDVFQLDELVHLYQVPLYTELEEKSSLCYLEYLCSC